MGTGLRATAFAATIAAVVAGAAAAAGAPDPDRASQWYLEAVHADAAHRVSEGRGALVAIVDTGVDATHEDLVGRVVAGPDLVDGSGSDHDPNGHGTHLAGIIAARAGNGVGIAGAAPRARILAIRALGADRVGTSTAEADGVDDAVANGAAVINLSINPSLNVLSTVNPLSDVVAAVNRATAAGVVVVAAAGNYNAPLCAQPIFAAGIICVGAVERDERRSAYSDYAIRVDVMAPGGGLEPIVSTLPGNRYGGLTGTSQATAIVSAEAALLVSLGLRGKQVVDRILATATDIGARGQDLQTGHGLVNMQAAVAGLGPPLTAGADRLSANSPASVRASTLLRGGLRVRFSMTTVGRVSATLTDTRRRVLARGATTLPRAGRGVVVLKPTRTGRRALASSPRLSGTLTLRGPDGLKVTRKLRVRR